MRSPLSQLRSLGILQKFATPRTLAAATASTDIMAAWEALSPMPDLGDPACASCGHGVTAHALMGVGTCAGDRRPSWREPASSACPCDCFRFAVN